MMLASIFMLIISVSACKKKCYYCEKNGARVTPTVCPNDASYASYKDNCDWYKGFWVEDK